MATLKNTIVNSTGALQLPVGTTAQRPTATAGQMRYNSSLGTCEFYDGTMWKYMPDIVRSGLVLHLDAAEPLSYNTVFENLLLWSENYLASSVWDVTSYPITVTLQPSITPPIDNMAVYSMVQNGTWGLGFQNISTSVTGTGILTATIYAKQYTSTGFTLNAYYNEDTEVNINFNLSNGTCGTGGVITNVGNGWYRCQIQVPARVGAGTLVQFRIWPDYRGANTSNGCYFAGAQLETGSSASTYFKTTLVIKTRTTTWADLSGNGNNGTLTNGPTYNSENGGSIVFDGNDDYVDILDSVSLSFSSYISIDGWFYANSFDASVENAIVRKQNQWALQTLGNSSIRCLIATDGTTGWTGNNDVAYSFSTGTWYYFAMTWNGLTMYIYVNGILVKTATVTGAIVDNSNSVQLGLANTTYANFNISSVKIYDRCLNGAEIVQNFNALRGRYGI